MKAIGLTEFGGPDVLQVVDLPTPEPGPGEVGIRGPHPCDRRAESARTERTVGMDMPQKPGGPPRGSSLYDSPAYSCLNIQRRPVSILRLDTPRVPAAIPGMDPRAVSRSRASSPGIQYGATDDPSHATL